MEKQSAGGGGGSGGEAEAEVSGLRCGEEFLGSPKEVPLWPAGRPGGPGVSTRRLGALGTDSSRPCSSSRRMLEVAKALDAEEDARFSRSLLWSFFCLVRRFWNQTFTLGQSEGRGVHEGEGTGSRGEWGCSERGKKSSQTVVRIFPPAAWLGEQETLAPQTHCYPDSWMGGGTDEVPLLAYMPFTLSHPHFLLSHLPSTPSPSLKGAP